MKFVISIFLELFPQDAGKSKPCENKVAVETFLGMSSIWLRNGFSLSLCIRTTPMLFVSTYISNRKGVNYNSRALNNIFPCLITYTYEFRGWMTSRVEFLSHISFFYIYEILLPCNSRKIYVQDIEWQLIPTCHQKYPSGFDLLLYEWNLMATLS